MSLVLVQVIVGGLLLGAVYALFSSGLTLVWGMMNVVNFAHGDFVMLGMYVAFVVYTVMGGGPLLGAPLAILLLATLGIIVYFARIRDIMKICRHLSGQPRLPGETRSGAGSAMAPLLGME